ncbi:MAG TPA: hypothetical protein PKY77_07260 [Phycisphaerae bacterium]|nr:hypothetical protein [Phycisphaerae bacterium]HRY67800.1 hypothetical protein [Phycisphaerae bacterium]HSA25252.1 hypothetical protein [Phycisphaerae bacterium]
MANPKDEMQERTCRSCRQPYRYPGRGSLATRFHCEACAELPAPVRAAFERFHRQIALLTSRIEQLERQVSVR